MENKTKKPSKKELLSIPNIMGYFRILLIPFFCYFYISGEWNVAAIILIISTITDFLDGQIARRCNMITNFGKILDPVADKFTHFAIALCLAFRYKLMAVLLILMVVKESYMAIMGIRSLRKDNKLSGAKWFGKVSTAVLFISLAYLVIFTDIS
ncbi:MAG: CDP-alcohol phosphatidyltransferase family protein, partial [Clostridiales bacterium]|nr:CDP-alcohol phosphatidyltransferase family protein [Clostridiales bacterium]